MAQFLSTSSLRLLLPTCQLVAEFVHIDLVAVIAHKWLVAETAQIKLVEFIFHIQLAAETVFIQLMACFVFI